MKVKIFRLFTATAIFSALLSSCDHEFDHFHGLPDYSYFRTGYYESSLTTDTSALGQTVFEYCSWAEAATRYDRAEVVLEASLSDVNDEVSVNNFIVGDGTPSFEYSASGNHRKREITVIDSLMIYRIRYNNFTLEYKMPFQTAFYNDGKTSGQMAYLCFDPKITDNGYQLSDLNSEIVGGQVYMRKLFRHSINVRFGGKNYRATATVVLKRRAGNENGDFVVKTTLLDSGIRDFESDGNYASYVSWIKVRQDFYDGKTETTTFEVLMYGKMTMQPLAEMNITGANLEKESAGFDQNREHVQIVARNDFVDAAYYERYYVVRYNYGTTTTLFQHVEAVYNDGFEVIEFPSVRYTDIKDSGVLKKVSSGNDEHGSYGEYEFTQQISARFGEAENSESNAIRVFLTE